VSQYIPPVPENQTPEVTPVEAIPPQPVAAPGSQDLSAQIEALRAKNAELIGERRKDKEARETLQAQLDQLAQAQQEAKTQKLAETGEYRTLWEEAQQTVADLKQQIAQRDATIEEIRTGFTKEQVRATAVAQLAQAGAVAPDQLYRLVQENLRAKEGQPVAVSGGVEVPIGDFIANLKNPGSGYEHHFAASNRSGMGVTSSARSTAVPGQTNPWSKEAWNITQQMMMLVDNPDMARLLKSEAGA
jgi:rhamnose utilization protein RhaD (predicted bifunctional aldolase and dehydrogenase)